MTQPHKSPLPPKKRKTLFKIRNAFRRKCRHGQPRTDRSQPGLRTRWCVRPWAKTWRVDSSLISHLCTVIAPFPNDCKARLHAQLMSISWRGPIHRDPSTQSAKKCAVCIPLKRRLFPFCPPLQRLFPFLLLPPLFHSLSLSPNAGLFSVEEFWTLTAPPP